MSSRNLREAKSPDREVVLIAGSFAPAGTGAPTAAKGSGFSVARSGVGVFTITLDKIYPDMLSAVCSLQLATAADQYVLGGTYTAASGTFVINVWDVSGAALADISANANNRVNFILAMKNSTV